MAALKLQVQGSEAAVKAELKYHFEALKNIMLSKNSAPSGAGDAPVKKTVKPSGKKPECPVTDLVNRDPQKKTKKRPVISDSDTE